ncbi:MAG: CPBP family intramembrane metalloprotease [Rhodospirillales bacterium]|nr:CPBP family intramembrane metalloprotease [Rhodospirillales bacterium]
MLLLLGGGLALTHLRGLSALEILGQGAAWLGVSWLIGFTEELAFRGYLLQTLARGMGFWPAALLTSLLFAALHITNAHETVIGIMNVFGAGMILCIALKRSFSLWWSIGFHAGWDYAENFIYGTHDSGQACAGALLNTLPRGPLWLSGGLAGPEGSLLGLGVEVLVAAGLYIFLRPRTSLT